MLCFSFLLLVLVDFLALYVRRLHLNSIFLFIILFSIRGKERWVLNRYEVFILAFSGIIRGTVAFALMSKEEPSEPNK